MMRGKGKKRRHLNPPFLSPGFIQSPPIPPYKNCRENDNEWISCSFLFSINAVYLCILLWILHIPWHVFLLLQKSSYFCSLQWRENPNSFPCWIFFLLSHGCCQSSKETPGCHNLFPVLGSPHGSSDFGVWSQLLQKLHSWVLGKARCACLILPSVPQTYSGQHLEACITLPTLPRTTAGKAFESQLSAGKPSLHC